MITFVISTGQIYAGTQLIGTGYAGNGTSINNPSDTQIHRQGPLPVGYYVIGTPEDRPTTGPFSIPLTPDAGNEMYSRSQFYIHGGKIGEPDTSPAAGPPGPRTASDGCVATARDIREIIAQHQILQVVAEPFDTA